MNLKNARRRHVCVIHTRRCLHKVVDVKRESEIPNDPQVTMTWVCELQIFHLF